MSFFVKTESDPESMVKTIRSRVLALGPDQPVFNIRTLENYLSDRLQPRRLSFITLTVFAVFSLLLTAVGIYGLRPVTSACSFHEESTFWSGHPRSLDLHRSHACSHFGRPHGDTFFG